MQAKSIEAGACADRYRAEQAGVLKRFAFSPQAPTREGKATRWAWLAILQPLRPLLERTIGIPITVFGQQLVAEHAVDRQVDNANIEIVLPALNGISDVHAVRRLPENAQLLAVQSYFGYYRNSAEVQCNNWFQQGIGYLRRLEIKGLPIGGRPGEVLHALLTVFTP